MPTDVQTLLGAERPRRQWLRRLAWAGVGGVVLAAAAGAWLQQRRGAQAPQYVTEAVQRGAITLSVLANGTLQPTRSVNVGSELSGTVRNVLVDVNDRIRKDQVLVELDTAKLSAQVLRSRAALASAHARQAQAQATLREVQANLQRQEGVARQSGGQVPSVSELDAARASVERAQADLASAQAAVQDAKAALSTDETSLSKASIRSPIDGVVLSRSVEPGNAVAAALQAVTLLTVAEDLAQLQLQVNVDEADVGSVQSGQKASFTVSAFPARQYPAQVVRVAYGSTKTDNVVTYTAWLQVDNADLSLRPGMTAAATITAVQHADVLMVPNTALRFSPVDASAPSPGASEAKGGGIVSQIMPRPPRTMARSGGGNKGQGKAHQVWVLQDGKPQAIAVQTGISDGRMTEVQGDALREGMAAITDQRSSAAKP